MEEKRNNSIDNLKAICTFLIISIHVPFPGEIGAYFITLTRIAVPIFFMITGFFYLDIIFYHKEVKQIKKILKQQLYFNKKKKLLFFFNKNPFFFFFFCFFFFFLFFFFFFFFLI